MERKLNVLDWASLILIIIGGINWGLVGLFDINVVSLIFGDDTVATRVVYSLVGLAALYSLFTSAKVGMSQTSTRQMTHQT